MLQRKKSHDIICQALVVFINLVVLFLFYCTPDHFWICGRYIRAEVKSGHISPKGYRDSPVIILCPFTDYPIIPSLFCIQMAHIQHELLENQKCDTLQFYGVAYYLITIASAVIFCYFNGTNLY